MTIQEAIKTGKKYKRPRHDYYGEAYFTGAAIVFRWYGTNDSRWSSSLSLEDIIADDWAVQFFKKSPRLLDFSFPNGNRIEVTESGFTLWDNYERRWVIDASCVASDDTIRLSGDLNPGNDKGWTQPQYHSKYLLIKKSKTKTKRKKK